MSSQQHASGLAASIRKATESETFDLAGHSAATIEKQFHDAFAEPFELNNNKEMIRLTFVTGAGKLGRQKYDDGAAKAVTATLRELGYQEDRGASAVLECAGSFKLQHDTGKNLKTVVVFPKVVINANDVGSGGGDGDGGDLSLGQLNLGEGSTSMMLQEGTPQHKLAYSSMNVFGRMIETQCQTWSQKKACIEAIDNLKEMVQSLDDKLMMGTPLSGLEQEFYESVSMTSLEEKLSQIRELMHKQVDACKITSDEQSMLLQQVGERIQKLEKEIADAKESSKPKRVENLITLKQKAEERRAKLKTIAPLPAPPLKNESNIFKLRKELVPLEEIEAGAKGRLLTLKESQAVARKEEILEEIAALEIASRGWFESDEAFDARVEHSRSSWREQKRALKKKAPKSSSGNTRSTTKTTTSNKWVTPSGPRATVASKSASRKAKPSGGGSLFAAMMDDSDSD